MKIVVALLLLTTAAHAQTPGVENERRAKINWMMSCQGCHQPDATGSVGGAPSMANDVARFLSVEGGREYLTRVPGVVNAGMSDAQLAELMNWTLSTFDSGHMPASFEPFTADEIARGRKMPLVSEAQIMRAALREKFVTAKDGANGGD